MRMRFAAAVVAGSLALGVAPAVESAPLSVSVLAARIHVYVGERVNVRPGYGKLHVNVDPERAKVYIDGRYQGRGDCTRTLREGRHTVRVVLASGRRASEVVRVEDGRITKARLDLD